MQPPVRSTHVPKDTGTLSLRIGATTGPDSPLFYLAHLGNGIRGSPACRWRPASAPCVFFNVMEDFPKGYGVSVRYKI